MSLDQNLFTLVVTPSQEDPNVIDLVDTAGVIHYRKQRLAVTPMYTVEIYGRLYALYGPYQLP